MNVLGSFQMSLRLAMVLSSAVVVSAVAGCGPTKADPRVTQIQELEDRVEQQGRDLAAKDAQLQAQADQIQTLQGLGGDKAIDRLVHVSSIGIDQLSGGYDDDRDGRDDGLVIYLRLLDDEQDSIKAAGSVLVRVMDLAAAEGPVMLGEVSFGAEELKSMWYGRLMSSHYAIKVPLASLALPPARDRLTVRALYTDLLTGRAFDAQAEVAFTLTPAPTTPAP